MSLEIRWLRDGEQLAYARAVMHHFYEDESDEDLQKWLPTVEVDRALVAVEGERIVGNHGVRTGTLSMPGGEPVPCAAVTAVGVAQTHRRQGLLTRMMREALDQAVERGEPVAALYASESPIYGRYGFGVSIPTVRYRADRSGLRFRDPVAPSLVRPASVDEALEAWPGILETGVRAHRSGCLDRPAAYWQLWLANDPPSWREGMTRRRLVHVPGRGYAAYRVKDELVDVLPAGTVRVEELVAVDAEAEQALWQHVLDLDLTATVEADLRPGDDALPWLVTDPLRLRPAASAPTYTRLLDVPAALAARAYTTAGQTVLEVHDGDRDQSGTYRLEAGSDGAECVRADGAEPHLALPVDALASLWLGGVRATQLVAARRVEERRPGAAAALDRLLATDRLPWTPFEF